MRGSVSLTCAALAAAIILGAGSASACSCIQRSIAQHVCSTAYIFEGEVTGNDSGRSFWKFWRWLANAPDEDHNGLQVTTFRLTRAWKGVTGEEVKVAHVTSSAACGLTFEEGSSQLVFANESEGEISTNLCTQMMAADGTFEAYKPALEVVATYRFANEESCIAAVDAVLAQSPPPAP